MTTILQHERVVGAGMLSTPAAGVRNRTPKEAVMSCPKCGGDDRRLYHVPVARQVGSVPICVACFFCYLKVTGDRPPLADLVAESGTGSHS
jgi:hypothetical protein